MKKPIPPPPKLTHKAIPHPPKIVEQQVVYLNNDSPRPPPSAVDLEEAVLGAIIIDTSAIREVENILSSEVFFLDKHKIIYRAIESLVSQKIGIDLLTVSTELKRIEKLGYIGGDFYLIGLTQKVSSSAHIEYHTRIILQKYVLRELIKNSRSVLFQSLQADPDVFNLMDSVKITIDNIHKIAVRQDDYVLDVDPTELLKLKVAQVALGNKPGIAIGISEFDEWSGGLQERELITLAARTGMGKTTAMLAISGNIAIDREVPVAFFSLEMSSIDLLYRMASRLANVPYNKIRKGEVSMDELSAVANALKYLKTSNLQIYDTMFHKNIYEKIEAKIRELAAKEVKLFIIDYVQLMKLLMKTTDRTGDLSAITRQLKGLTNELSITIVILAQVSRSTDSRTGSKVPLLSDLKQSGSIEEDSDMVIFLVRDAYYRQEHNSTIELPPHVLSDTNFIVAKGRSTGTRTFRTYLDFLTYKMTTYSDM